MEPFELAKQLIDAQAARINTLVERADMLETATKLQQEDLDSQAAALRGLMAEVAQMREALMARPSTRN